MITEQIKKNDMILRDIESIAQKITVSDSNKRDMIYTGYYRTALSHYCSISILMDKEQYTSAFALIRVFFDSVVRGLYVYHVFDDKKIEEFYVGKANFVKTETMCKTLDSIYNYNFFNDIRERTYENMCDYTHTGVLQVARNFNESRDSIEPNFNEPLILDALKGISSLTKILTLDYFEKIGCEYGIITIKEIENIMNRIDTILDLEEQ